MKKTGITGIFILVLLLILSGSFTVFAADEDETEKIYQSQLSASGAEDLFYALPEETKALLSQTNLDSLTYNDISNFNLENIIELLKNMLPEKNNSVFSAALIVLGIILLCSMLECTGMTGGESPVKKNISAVGSLCICTAAVVPLCSLISRCSEVIQGGAGFMTMYVPVMAGLMVSSSHQIQGASYYTTLMGISDAIGLLSSKIITPLVNVFLSLSITSSISPILNYSGICSAISRSIKWILNFSLAIFVTVLSAQSFITSSLDDVSTRAVKFAMNSFVPVVGGVLSETIGTFSGSLSLLKSGTGVFIIIASSCIFLPVLMECLIWRVFFYFLGAISDMLGLGMVKGVLSSVETVTSLLTAVLFTIIMIFTISTVIILMIGK